MIHEIVVKACNNKNSKSFQKYDIVECKAGEDHDWGKKVCFPTFIIIKIETSLIADLSYLKEEGISEKRKYKFKFDKELSIEDFEKLQLDKNFRPLIVMDKIKVKA